ncbi:exopolysaccharide biosynthesis protein [Nordella sp. HKS 07]|uniref:polysaccharide biosynthesis/export family protein n=1 Tax=Nordella sp. HKS 07 TaxID=2712222 RepID=UPI0013E14747|nr:polysaccharide biosynthesis/export family protein [Nordella sp. HKS 07]QIG51843.1 exopolysaccharide biosynthesis protein [Nordella sp. HKS 07]
MVATLYLKCLLVLALVCGSSASASADSYQLAPYTKLRLTVLQWNPIKGEYFRWDAIDGEYTVSQDGAISVPLVGSVHTANLDGEKLQRELATRVRTNLALLTPPNVTVEIVEYPPVYIVGSVAAPGEYRFRPGLTVLQALALAGGKFRPRQLEVNDGNVTLLGEMQGIQFDVARAKARIARLQAELSGAKDIVFPDELTPSEEDRRITEIVATERAIFSARENAKRRQLATLTELKEFLSAEIEMLEERAKGEDRGIKLVEEQLDRVSGLVEKGFSTTARESDLELILTSMRSSRLDRQTAILRARQGLSEAARSADGVRDERLTAVATELQEAKANLEHLKSRELVLRSTFGGDREANSADEPRMTYTIVRKSGGHSTELDVSESTQVDPNDVVKVEQDVGTREGGKSPNQQIPSD